MQGLGQTCRPSRGLNSVVIKSKPFDFDALHEDPLYRAEYALIGLTEAICEVVPYKNMSWIQRLLLRLIEKCFDCIIWREYGR